MAVTAAQYLEQIQALLPPGAAWAKGPGARLTGLLRVAAEELFRVDGRADVLVEEADPTTTNELLAEWERVAGLPAPCLPTPPTALQERRAALLTLLTSEGAQSEAFFIALAARLGYTVTITYPPATPHTFTVNAPTVTVTESSCMSPCTDPLRTWGNDVLECAINTFKPAHVAVLFAYA